MKTTPLALATSMAALLFVSPPAAAAEAAHSHAAAAEAPASAKLQATRDALRKLWRGHAEAVRKVVVAKIANDPAGEKTAEAGVVANAHDIASAISPFYGQARQRQAVHPACGPLRRGQTPSRQPDSH